MKTIEKILKHAEQIGKEPGQKQDQRTINKLKIGMRFAVELAQKLIPIEQGLPPIDESVENCQLSISCLIYKFETVEISRYSYWSKRWVCSFPESVTHWRPLEIK